jgi:hypothetical protein
MKVNGSIHSVADLTLVDKTNITQWTGVCVGPTYGVDAVERRL